MKRIIIALLSVFPLISMAQIRIGYLSYQKVMQQMPEYKQVQDSLLVLKTKNDEELKLSEEKFQRLFADFLQGQKNFTQNIMLKRQSELQSQMEINLKYRRETEKVLSDAEHSLLAEVRGKLDAAIEAVGIAGGYFFVLNTDENRVPFQNPAVCKDITNEVLRRLVPAHSVGTLAQP